MDDLISRQAVSSWLKQYGQDVLHGKYKFSLMYIWKNLMDLPPAQPEPREGHWIRRGCGLDVECKCSRCGYKDFVEPGDEYWFNRNFCPNCGARMKGVSNERTD